MSIGTGIAVAGMWLGIALICWAGRDELSGFGYVLVVTAGAIATIIALGGGK
jgi:hypothetical protein